MQEVKLLSRRQEISKGVVEDKNQVAEQSNGKLSRDFFFEEMEELEKRIRKRNERDVKQEGCKDLEAREG